MSQSSSLRQYTRSAAAVRTRRVALATLFVALGVALSPFGVPVLGARVFPVQSLLNVLGAAYLGPLYAVLVALMVSIIRNATGLGTPLAYAGSMIGALLAAFGFRIVTRAIRPSLPTQDRSRWILLAAFAAAFGELVGTGLIGSVVDGALIAPAVFHHALAATIFIAPFAGAALVGGIAGVVAVVALGRAGIAPDTHGPEPGTEETHP